MLVLSCKEQANSGMSKVDWVSEILLREAGIVVK